MFKILKGLVPNPGIIFKENMRTGIKASVPKINNTLPLKVRSMKEQSFNVEGPKLFNCMPQEIRDFNSDSQNPAHSFKNKLDAFLTKIPDQPTVYGLIRAATTNSMIHQVAYKLQ